MARRLVVCLILAGLAAVPAAAGVGKGDFEIGAYVGYGFLDAYGNEITALNPGDDVLYGFRAGYFLSQDWSLEFNFQHLEAETSPNVATPSKFDLNSVRLNLLYNFGGEESKVRPYITLGAGVEATSTLGIDDDDTGYNIGGGARFFLDEGFGLRLDARYVSYSVGGFVDETVGNFETSLGILLAFGGGPPRDTDADGVPDKKDDCPGTPAGAVVDDRGCPIDGDGDGVFDGLDACPDTPAGATVDSSGCPIDSDGDGVYDGLDACPDTPAGATVDDKGCPIDSDGDGVYDGLDKCPDTPSGVTVVDADGCPVDSDRDGVYDGLDKCPGTPQGVVVDEEGCPIDSDGDGVPDGLDKCLDTPPNTTVDEHGCPVLFDEARKALVLEGVKFGFDSADLTGGAKGILTRVAEALVNYPEIRLEVAGYSDSQGNDAYNQKLSQRRAESVREYLISGGVPAGQMVAKGYGEADPIADNGTKDGRERNRRVVLRKLE